MKANRSPQMTARIKSPTRKMKRLRSTAVHEAGHAVAALALGVRFKHVTIIPEEAYANAGHVRMQRSRNQSRDYAFNRVVVALSGVVAAKAAGYRPALYGWEADRSAAVAWADTYAGGLGLTSEWIDLGFKTAEVFERRHRDLIHALADALLERQTLSEQECREILRARTMSKAGSGRPPQIDRRSEEVKAS